VPSNASVSFDLMKQGQNRGEAELGEREKQKGFCERERERWSFYSQFLYYLEVNLLLALARSIICPQNDL